MFERFKEHPNSLGETYCQHMVEAITISSRFAIASLACFLHAFFPFLFETTASSIAKDILDKNNRRRDD